MKRKNALGMDDELEPTGSLIPLPTPDGAMVLGAEVIYAEALGGLFIVGLRDYSWSMNERPLTIDPPMVSIRNGNERIAHQLWLWSDERRYITHAYIDTGSDHLHFSTRCRAWLPTEVKDALLEAGFTNISWLPGGLGKVIRSAHENGFDQLIATARVRYGGGSAHSI